MTTYRTIMKNGEVHIQRKGWFGIWVDVSEDFDANISFSTEAEAAEEIRKWQKIDKENGKVLKEYRDDS